uniref:Uncharacterized protein n=1 Tax=Aegilops tauschii subsp. strangulata TaxID=200361 RepID=A0A453J5F0_AEGTS
EARKMGRVSLCSEDVDPLVWTPVPGIAVDTLFLLVIQALAIILVSNLFHSLLRRYNQPNAISQILAGMVVGGMGLRNAIVHIDVDNVEDMYNGYIAATRILYMFLVGLETDIASLRSTARRCVAFTYATVAASLLLAAIVSSGMYGSMMHSPVRTPEMLAATLMVALTNTSSLSVARIADDLKLTVTENGRLLVSAAIGTNIICVIGDGVLRSTRMARENSMDVSQGFVALTGVGLALWLVRPAVTRVNQRNVGQHHVRRRDLAFMISAIWIVGNFPQKLGFDGLPTSFALGLVFPREGPAARSVADALVPPVNGLLIPFYFATIGMRMNFNTMSGAIILPGVLMMLLGLVGKAIGAAVASAYLNIPLCDALRFSVLLNVKGHVDTMNMQFAKSEGVWAEQALYAMIIGNLASTLVAGPAAAVFVRKEKEAYAMTHQALESLREEAELRMMTCSHSAHSMPALLSLVELMVMEPAKQPAVQVVHLFEGGHKRAAAAAAAASPTTPYLPPIIDEYDAGREAINDMNTVVDLYLRSTGIALQQIDVVCSSASRDVDAVCRCAAEARAALLLLPCYREQRYDGKMACRLEERRELNVGVLAKAPCTVGLLMDRPYRSSGASFQVPTSVDTSTSTLLHPCSDRAVRHVIAAVFLGGADDREAVSVASRLAENPNIGLTVFRFVKLSTYDTVTSSSSRSAAAAACEGLSRPFNDAEVDERFMWRFYENYAATEMAMYVEKVVESPADVVETLDAMAGMFSLVIVGRAGRQPKELLVGLDEWAEAGRELGAVAEILASNTSMEMGSVLIMQQHRVLVQVPR